MDCHFDFRRPGHALILRSTVLARRTKAIASLTRGGVQLPAEVLVRDIPTYSATPEHVSDPAVATVAKRAAVLTSSIGDLEKARRVIEEKVD